MDRISRLVSDAVGDDEEGMAARFEAIVSRRPANKHDAERLALLRQRHGARPGRSARKPLTPEQRKMATERQLRYMARKRGEDVPLRRPGRVPAEPKGLRVEAEGAAVVVNAVDVEQNGAWSKVLRVDCATKYVEILGFSGNPDPEVYLGPLNAPALAPASDFTVIRLLGLDLSRTWLVEAATDKYTVYIFCWLASEGRALWRRDATQAPPNSHGSAPGGDPPSAGAPPAEASEAPSSLDALGCPEGCQ